MSRPLLELCGRHVVVLQMKVPQIALLRQLENVTWSFTFCFSAFNRGLFCSPARVFGYLDFQCSSWVLQNWRFFPFRTGAAGVGLRGTEGKRSPSSASKSLFSLGGSFLEAGRTSGLSSSSSSSCMSGA